MKKRLTYRALAVIATLLGIMAVAAPVMAQGIWTSPVVAVASGVPGININAAAAAAGLTPAQINGLERQAAQALQGQLPNLYATGSNAGSVNAYAMGLIDQLAAALGITPQQLLTELQSGQTIAQVAQANNVNLQTEVIQPLLAAEQAALQGEVQAGTLTQAQANAALAASQAELPVLAQIPLNQLLGDLGSVNLNGLYHYGLGFLQNP